MASLYQRKDSPHWWLQYKDNGKRKLANTGLRHDSPDDTAKARRLRAEWEAKEFAGVERAYNNWDWVDAYFENLDIAPRTRAKYFIAWNLISLFLLEKRILPGTVRYEHAQQYVDWRLAGNGHKHKRKLPCRNTANGDLKTWKQVINESVRRGMAVANPFYRMRLRKSPIRACS